MVFSCIRLDCIPTPILLRKGQIILNFNFKDCAVSSWHRGKTKDLTYLPRHKRVSIIMLFRVHVDTWIATNRLRFNLGPNEFLQYFLATDFLSSLPCLLKVDWLPVNIDCWTSTIYINSMNKLNYSRAKVRKDQRNIKRFRNWIAFFIV